MKQLPRFCTRHFEFVFYHCVLIQLSFTWYSTRYYVSYGFQDMFVLWWDISQEVEWYAILICKWLWSVFDHVSNTWWVEWLKIFLRANIIVFFFELRRQHCHVCWDIIRFLGLFRPSLVVSLRGPDVNSTDCSGHHRMSSKRHIAAPLGGESTAYWWIRFTKSQQSRKIHVMRSSYNNVTCN